MHKMGQVQSDEYQCSGDSNTRDISDSELNSRGDASAAATAAWGHQPATSRPDAKGSPGPSGYGDQQQQQHVRKLSIVSHRNIQLLSMKPRSERAAYADDLRVRRRSSLINLILGAPSRGPRFSEDLCSLNSHMTECNFGIEFFPDIYQTTPSLASLNTSDEPSEQQRIAANQNNKRRRSSIGSICARVSDDPQHTEAQQQQQQQQQAQQPSDSGSDPDKLAQLAPSSKAQRARQHFRKSSLASTLASIDLTSSFDHHVKSQQSSQVSPSSASQTLPSLLKARQTIFEEASLQVAAHRHSIAARASGKPGLRRAGSELSLYSSLSSTSETSSSNRKSSLTKKPFDASRETQSIIMLQVCLPFILAGFGNMAAGLVLNQVAKWRAFQHIPSFFIMLPPFIGLKGNIEMTLASRLSTLSNLKLLQSSDQRKRAYASNLILILSQAIGLSLFAATISIVCELFMGGIRIEEHNPYHTIGVSILVMLASALSAAIVTVVISSLMMPMAIVLANLLEVNPDNLSTLIAALYGDVTCVLIYGLAASLMFQLIEQGLWIWPMIIVIATLTCWPGLLLMAYRFKETHSIALASIPPMLTSIIISMGSGAVLSLVVGRFKLIALYQPVVNGFGANLIAVQASRVSTWLWCSALRRISRVSENIEAPKKLYGSLVSFTPPSEPAANETSRPSLINSTGKLLRTIFWSFCNSSPNSIAARLLLVMLIPAHSIYFFVIWLLSESGYVVITWQFYLAYITLCLVQVTILLTICEPLMTLLMHRGFDPDIFGISILMALADLIGTLCLTGAFYALAGIGDASTQVDSKI